MDNGPNSSVLETAGYVGNAECTVGRAFACMDYGLKRDDLVVVAGEMSDGKSMRVCIAMHLTNLSFYYFQFSIKQDITIISERLAP